MKHITYSDSRFLIGDEAADVLISYAVMLAGRGDADAVRFAALSNEGDELIVTILLANGPLLLTETTRDDHPEPDNAHLVDYLRERLRRISGGMLPALPVDARSGLHAGLDGDLELG